jgi:hypothetical protein
VNVKLRKQNEQETCMDVLGHEREANLPCDQKLELRGKGPTRYSRLLHLHVTDLTMHVEMCKG